MSHTTPNIYTYNAGADLTGKQYHIAKNGTKDNECLLGDSAASSLGVIMNLPCGKIGEEIEIARSNGGAKVVAAAAIAAGLFFTCDAAGKAVVAADRATALGVIDEAATAADQIVSVTLF